MVTRDTSHLNEQFLFPRLSTNPVEVILHTLTAPIQQAVQDFRSESSQWEDEVRSLFDDVDRFMTAEQSTAGTASVAQDVAGLKGLVQQQTEVLAALVNALTSQSTDLESECDQPGNEPVAREFDPFARLQQAVAAASEAN